MDVAGALSGEFKKGVNDQAFQRILWHLREQDERIKKQSSNGHQGGKADDFDDFALSAIIIEQAELFQQEIDIWQQATVETIMDYDVAIERAEEVREQILLQAHRLEDGRRVFKTEDGQRVFDEDGNEIGSDLISPDDIDDRRPTWEQFLDVDDALKQLRQHRQEALDFQARLDEAKERLDSGEMTQKEFEELRQNLFDSAPCAIRQRAIDNGLDFGTDASVDPAIPQPPAESEIAIKLDDELAALPKPSIPAPG